MDKKEKVLFLCSHNSCRSQMAEMILRRHGGDRYIVHSAGLHPSEVHPLTLAVLKEQGYDTTGLRSKAAAEFLNKEHFSYVIIVCSKADKECPSTWPLVTHRLYWPFEDPQEFEGSDEEKLDKFREVRDTIETHILNWLERK
jgi:arsenate reductase (thioredoxin)